jgi:acyl-CoA thioester hydrolase
MAFLTIKPRFHEFDMYGILHHRAYFSWFEEARAEFFSQRGIDVNEVHRQGFHLVLLKSEVDYLKAVTPGQDVHVTAALTGPSLAKLEFLHEVRHPATRQIQTKARITLAVVKGGELLLRLPDLLHVPPNGRN